MSGWYSALASLILASHLLFIVWVVFGAIAAYFRPKLRWLHIPCLVWGILVELLPWPCPLTWLENWLEARAGVQAYQGGFVLHYLDATVYPHISPTLLTVLGVAICAGNLSFYGWVMLRRPGH